MYPIPAQPRLAGGKKGDYEYRRFSRRCLFRSRYGLNFPDRKTKAKLIAAQSARCPGDCAASAQKRYKNAGDSFGELALLYNCPRAATVASARFARNLVAARVSSCSRFNVYSTIVFARFDF